MGRAQGEGRAERAGDGVTVIDVAQRTPEWFAARLGRLTGSCAKDAIATIKTGEAATRRDLRTRLVLERLTGKPQEDGYINAAMQWGIDREAEAFAAYEAITGEIVTRTGFCQHDFLKAGCSLDGHIGDFHTLVSLKCPKSATHLGYLKGGDDSVPAEHVPQMLHELWITGAKVYDFLSYDPRFPLELQVFYVRAMRDDAAVKAYADKAMTFLDEVTQEEQTVRALIAA